MSNSQQAAVFADMVLTHAWNGSIPVDPIAIAKSFGINVAYDDLPSDVSGALVKTKEMKSPIILVDNSEPDVRKRFTIAHEIGHYVYNTAVLQLNDYEKIDYRNDKSSDGQNEEEVFANNFAAALLMPSSFLKSANLQIGVHRIELASRLKVSLEALNYRINTFIKGGGFVDGE